MRVIALSLLITLQPAFLVWSTLASTSLHQRSRYEHGVSVLSERRLSSSRLFNSLSKGGGNLLQIPCTVQSTSSPISAFLDTGAQVTVISLPAAIRCGISHLIDRGYSGTATGVGSVDIIGKIPSVELRIGDVLVEVELVVLENTGVDLLLGLDVLGDLEADICLSRKCIRVKTAGDRATIPFVKRNTDVNEGREMTSSRDERYRATNPFVNRNIDQDEGREMTSSRDERLAFIDRGGASYTNNFHRHNDYDEPRHSLLNGEELQEDLYYEDEDEDILDECDLSGV